MWRNQWWKNLGINCFLFSVLISFLFSAQLSQPSFIFIVIANFYCLQIDSKHQYTNFTMGFVERWLGVIWPQLYYHLSSVRQVYARIILIWQQNDSYQQFKYIHYAMPQPTPMISSLRLTVDGSTSAKDLTFFRSIVGALQYVTITCPEISFVVNRVCQYMHQPQLSH